MNNQFVLIASDDHVDARHLEQTIQSFGCRVATIPREHMTSSRVRDLQPTLLILDLDRKGSLPSEDLSWQEKHCAQACQMLAMSTHAIQTSSSLTNIEYLRKPIDIAYVRQYLMQPKGGNDALEKVGGREAGPDSLEEIKTIIRDRCGLDLTRCHLNSFDRALKKRMDALGIRKYTDYAQLLGINLPAEDELSHLIDILTVGETSFFRYDTHDQALIDAVLPEIVQRRRREQTIRIWSAGCATGEEPYSLAMLIRKYFPHLLGWDIRIRATDINRQFLSQARTGSYTTRGMRSVPHDLQNEFFTSEQNHNALSESIRRMVDFEYFNLKTNSFPCQGASFTGFDLILCRNVMIYFDEASRKATLDKLIDCLHPQGYMFFGHTEFMQNFSRRLYTIRNGQAYYYRKKSDADSPEAPGPVAVALAKTRSCPDHLCPRLMNLPAVS